MMTERPPITDAFLEDMSFGIETRNDLTELPNRKFLDAHLARLIQQRVEQIIMLEIDVDGLKQINDDYGHHEGDNYLKNAAEVIELSIRSSGDVLVTGVSDASTIDLYHRSGDEFNVILTGVDADAAEQIKSRIQANLDDVGSGASIGVTHYTPGDTAGDLHTQSGRGLIKDKTRRRNKILTSEQKSTIKDVEKMLGAVGMTVARYGFVLHHKLP